MPAHRVPASESLPRSHYFFTFSRGIGMRTFAFRAPLVYMLALAIPLIGIAGIAAMLYIAFHDDLVASLMSRQAAQQYAYEDRIAGLRAELERQSHRRSIDQAAVERKVRDLVLREAKLEGRSGVLASLAGRTDPVRGATESSKRGPGVAAQRVAAAMDVGSPPKPQASELPGGVLSYAPAATLAAGPWARTKPHPEPELGAPESEAIKAPGPLSALENQQLANPQGLLLISASLDRVERGQIESLHEIGSRAREEAARVEEVLQQAGLSMDRFKLAPTPATGGPFVPLETGADAPFRDAALAAQQSRASADNMRALVAQVPLDGPLLGTPEISSSFGIRTDPFLGRPALHAGVDFRDEIGATVRATAAGRVAFAGFAGGYGSMVEVDHGNGLSSRYAHLSRIEVAEGQMLGKGGVVGQVGATGRATGPHLHYEIRIDREAVDPVRFLRAGTHLALAEVL